MNWRSMYLAFAAGLMFFLPGTASAQTSNLECKRQVTATGTASLTMNGAKENAIKAWTRSVVLQYGELYARWDAAETGKTADICGRSTRGLSRCEAKARPCAPKAAMDSHEIECTDNDSKKCVRLVKWIQSRLNAKNNAGLTVDGSEGEQTARAIRSFKRKVGLKDSDDASITDELLKALE